MTEENKSIVSQFIDPTSPNYFVVASWTLGVGNSNPEEGKGLIPCVAAQIIPEGMSQPIIVIWPEHVLSEWMDQFKEKRGEMIRSFPWRR